jgi:hypothetical protein
MRLSHALLSVVFARASIIRALAAACFNADGETVDTVEA